VSSGFTPLRTASHHVEGIKAYSHLYGLIPRLGKFVGNENRIPVDFKEILGAISPRPLLIISPELDRHADHEQVLESMKEVQEIYEGKASDNLQFKTPHEFNHFTQEQQNTMVEWLENQIRP